MFKFLNNKGILPIMPGVIVFYIAAGIIATATTVGYVKTAKNGVLKKNGKIIWCKMQNKGNDYCDNLYK